MLNTIKFNVMQAAEKLANKTKGRMGGRAVMMDQNEEKKQFPR